MPDTPGGGCEAATALPTDSSQSTSGPGASARSVTSSVKKSAPDTTTASCRLRHRRAECPVHRVAVNEEQIFGAIAVPDAEQTAAPSSGTYPLSPRDTGMVDDVRSWGPNRRAASSGAALFVAAGVVAPLLARTQSGLISVILWMGLPLCVAMLALVLLSVSTNPSVVLHADGTLETRGVRRRSIRLGADAETGIITSRSRANEMAEDARSRLDRVFARSVVGLDLPDHGGRSASRLRGRTGVSIRVQLVDRALLTVSVECR